MSNILDQFRLDGKIALVSGCTRGIGQAMAVALAEVGVDTLGIRAVTPDDFLSILSTP